MFLMGDAASNIKVNSGKRLIEVDVDTKIYPIDVVYSAAYVFLDKAYVLLKGDPERRMTVELRPKAGSDDIEDMERLGMEFNSQLLNYATYKTYSERNIDVKKMIMHEIFGSITGRCEDTAEETRKEEQEYRSIEIEDPDGILIPWEEKYGEKSHKDEDHGDNDESKKGRDKRKVL